jgi:glycosyltransferase
MNKVSIITITKNSEKTILNAVLSVEQQNYKNIEHIIKDCLSSDKTLEILNKLNLKNINILSIPDIGIYDGFNQALSMTSGDIVGILNSDDSYSSNNIIERVVDIFDSTNCDVVYGNVKIFAQKGLVRNWKTSSFKSHYLKLGWMPPHPSLFLKKSIYDSIGFFNPAYKISGDYDFILRLFKEKNLKFHHIDENFVNMSAGGISNNGFFSHLIKLKEDKKALFENGYNPYLPLIFKRLQKLNQLSKDN